MTTRVISLNAVCTVSDVLQVLGSCRHNGFPVLAQLSSVAIDTTTLSSPSKSGNATVTVLCGLISRKMAKLLIRNKSWLDPSLYNAEEWRKMLQKKELTLSQVVDLLTSDDRAAVIDLRPFMNRSPFTVQRETLAMHTYRLFRTMGLRHLPVVDAWNRVVGIITRKNLLEGVIIRKFADTIKRALPAHLRARTSNRQAGGAAAAETSLSAVVAKEENPEDDFLEDTPKGITPLATPLAANLGKLPPFMLDRPSSKLSSSSTLTRSTLANDAMTRVNRQVIPAGPSSLLILSTLPATVPPAPTTAPPSATLPAGTASREDVKSI